MANAEHSGRPAGAPGATVLGAAAADAVRLRVVRVGLWLVAAVLVARQLAVVLATPRGERLTDLETWVGPEGVLHVEGSLYDSTEFTGTPFTGLVLKPFTRAAEQALGWAGPSAPSCWSWPSAWSRPAPCRSRWAGAPRCWPHRSPSAC